MLRSYYQENGEWTLDETSAQRLTIDGGDNIVFYFRLSRKSEFVIFNVLLPIVFLCCINVLLFVLPVDSGERIGFAVTMLLALAVFLTLVGDNLPKTSKPMPILSNYLLAILVLSVLMTVLAILNLRLYHQDETSVPPKLCQTFARLLLCRICKERKVTPDGSMVTLPYENNNMLDKKAVVEETIPEEDKSIKQFVTWKEVSLAIDIACLFAFCFSIISVNSYYFLTLKNGGEAGNFTLC